MEVAVLTVFLIAVARGAQLPGWRGAAITGVLTGGVVLTRFSLVPLALAVPLLLARRSLAHGALALALVAVTVGPWIARSYRLDGSVAPSRIGINLAVSLSDPGEQLLPIHNNDRIVPLLPERSDREHLSAALAFARDHPWRTVKMKLRNLLHVFNPRLLPYDHEPVTARARQLDDGRYIVEGGIARAPAAQWLHGAWRAALVVLAIVGLAIRGFRWDDGVLWAVVLTIAVVYTVFYPTTRLTTPMVFAFMAWSAVAVARR
jgi:hypothetical protein